MIKSHHTAINKGISVSRFRFFKSNFRGKQANLSLEGERLTPPMDTRITRGIRSTVRPFKKEDESPL